MEQHIFVTIAAYPSEDWYGQLSTVQRVEHLREFYEPYVEAPVHGLSSHSVTLTRMDVIGGVIVGGTPDQLAALQAFGALLGPDQTTYEVAPDVQFHPLKPQ